MYIEHLRSLIQCCLPVFGGLVLTLISYRIIGQQWQIADPELEGLWSDSMKIMRFGGPVLMLIGACMTVWMMLNS
jgi:hypothetical protein